MTSFVRRYLEADFTLAQGQFGSGGNSHTAKGLRMSARIATAGGDDAGTMVLAIYGMTLSEMQQLTVLPSTMTSVGQNTVVLRAGENGSAPAVVFEGNIIFAAIEANAMPEVCFRVQAIAAHLDKLKPVAPVTQQGLTDVSTLFGAIAKTMARSLENSGISGKIADPYLGGTAMQQASALARAAGIQWTVDGKTLAIYPAGQPRQGDAVEISAATGLRGYPSFQNSGITVSTLFQSTLKFGCKIHVQSQLQPACGDWYVVYIEYALDSMVPNGQWFATLTAGRINVGNNAGG